MFYNYCQTIPIKGLPDAFLHFRMNWRLAWERKYFLSYTNVQRVPWDDTYVKKERKEISGEADICVSVLRRYTYYLHKFKEAIFAM